MEEETEKKLKKTEFEEYLASRFLSKLSFEDIKTYYSDYLDSASYEKFNFVEKIDKAKEYIDREKKNNSQKYQHLIAHDFVEMQEKSISKFIVQLFEEDEDKMETYFRLIPEIFSSLEYNSSSSLDEKYKSVRSFLEKNRKNYRIYGTIRNK